MLFSRHALAHASNRRRISAKLSLSAAVAAVLASHSASAVILTWNDADSKNSWDLATGTNWVGGAAWNNAAPDEAIFNGPGEAITLGTPISAVALTFNSNGYTIGNGGTEANTLTLSGTTPTVTVTTAGQNASISAVIAGTVGFSKSGAGTLTLSGGNPYSGSTTVSAGTLKAGSGSALGSSAVGSDLTTVAAGATLDVNGQNLGAEVITINGQGVNNAGAIVNTGAGQQQALQFVTLGSNASVGGTARWDIRSNTTATLNMGGFTLTKSGSNDFHLVGVTVTNPGNIDVTQGSFWVETGTLLGGSATNTITVRNGAKLAQWANDQAQTWKLIFEDNTTWENNNSTSQWAGPVTLNGATTFLSTGATHNINGVISGTGSLIKSGANTLNLNAANTFTGGITINAGTLAVNVGGSVGGIRGTVNVNAGGTLALTATAGNALGFGTGTKVETLNISGGTVTTNVAQDNGWGIDINLTGGILSGTGRITLGQSNASDPSSINSLASANVSTISVGELRLRGDNANTNVNFTVADGAAGTDLQVNSPITNTNGTVGITKLGTGTMMLNGASTYGGTTNVSAGILALGSTGILSSSPFIVNDTGTFRVDAAGKTLTSLTAKNGSTLGLVAQAGKTTNVTGTFTLTNGATTSIAPILGVDGLGTYDLITAGSITGTGTPTLAFDKAYGPTRAAGTLAIIGNQLRLTVTATGANLVWNNASAAGAATGTWDLNSSSNFNNGGTTDVFKAFDAVTFDDTLLSGTDKTVNLSGILAPALITVSNSAGNYTFASTGTLAGAGSLIKTGSSTLTLSNTGGYGMIGDITVGGGTLDLGAKSITGVNKLTVSNDSTLTSGTVSATSFDLQAGTVSATLTGPGALNKVTAGKVILTAANTYTSANTISAGTVQIGPVTGSSTATLGSGATTIAGGASLTYYRNNNYGVANAFSGSGSLQFNGTNNGSGLNGQSGYSLDGNNSTFSGTLNATNSRVQIDNANDVGTAALSTGTNGQFYITAGTYTNNFTIAGDGWGESAGQLGAIRLQGGTLAGTITLAGDARITTHGGSGAISGPIVGGFGLTFGGTGAATNLTLSGANTYSGATTIGIDTGKTATVILTGSLGATAVTVNPGSTLAGGGSIATGGSLTFAAGATNLGVNAGLATPLTVGGNVNFNGSAGQVTVTVSPGQRMVPGTPLTLINFTGTSDAAPTDFTLANSSSYRTAIFKVTSSAVTLDLGTKALTWTGSAGAAWDFNNTANWSDGVPGQKFFSGDAVTFNDSGTGSVTLSGTLAPSTITVDNSTAAYTLTASTNNVIGGSTNLLKRGTGVLTLAGNVANTFAGGTTISQGEVRIQNAASLGSGPTTLGDAGTGSANLALYLDANRNRMTSGIVVANQVTGTVTLGSRSNIAGQGDDTGFTNITLNRDVIFDSNAADRTDYRNISGTGNITVIGTGRTIFNTANTYNGNLTIATTGVGSVQFGTATLGNQDFIPDTTNVTVNAGTLLNLSSGGESINGLNGAGTVSTNSINATLTVGAANGGGGFSGSIQNGGSNTVTLVKAGTGTQTLSGNNTYTGATTVAAGTLAVSGSISGSSQIAVQNSGSLLLGGTSTNRLGDTAPVTLGGTGTGSPATLQLDNSAGQISETVGVLTLANNSVLDLGTGSAGSVFHFTDSSTQSWIGTLSIYNWTSSTDHLFFGNSTAALTSGQLSSIIFYSDAGTTSLGSAGFLGGGEIAPVPEPTTLVSGLAMLGYVFLHSRRAGRSAAAVRRDS